MNSATIEVAYVNPPKEGRKMGDVKDTDGQYWKVWPDKLDFFKPGHKYDIEYTTDEFKGKTFCMVKKMTPVTENPPTATQKAVQTVSGNSGGRMPSVEMAVMGLVGRFLGGMGQGGAEYPTEIALTAMMVITRRAWINAFRDPPEEEPPY